MQRAKRGRPRAESPRECLCVWLQASERAQLKALALRLKTSISALSRRLLIHSLEAEISEDQIASITGLDVRRTYFGGPRPSRLTAMQCGHEIRARRLGVQCESVDFLAVYESEGGICGICREPVNFGVFTIDHIIPVSKGGPHIFANLQIAHFACNSCKGDRVPA